MRHQSPPLPVLLLLAVIAGSGAASASASASASTAAQPADVEEAGTLTLGILPFAAPKSIFQRYAPLRDWLAETLEQEVVIETARDFETFIERTGEERYDLLLTGAHLVRHAHEEGDYQPLVAATDQLSALIVTPLDARIESVDELGGRTIATPPRLSMGAVAVRSLLEMPLADKPPEYLYYPHHGTALMAMDRGLAEAAIMVVDDTSGSGRPPEPDTGRLVSLEDGQLVRMLLRTAPFPGAVIMAHDERLNAWPELTEKLAGLDDSPDGRERLDRIGHRGFEAFGMDDIPILAPSVGSVPEHHGAPASDHAPERPN